MHPLPVAFLVALLAGCGDGPLESRPDGPTTPRPVAAVAVAPGDLALDVGASAALTATPLDAAGTPLAGYPVAWTSTDTAVVTVSPAGLVSARGIGAASVRATSGGKSAGVAVTVGARAVAWIQISPAGGTIPQDPGTSRQLGVVARALDGTEVTGRSVAWSSSDPAVAAVSATGLLQARAWGTARITAVVDGRRDSTTVSVRSLVARIDVDPAELSLGVGGARTVAASARNEHGAALARTVAWSSSNSAVATVDAAGRVVATGAGAALVTVACEGRSATVRVTVTGQLWRLTGAAGAPLPAILYTTTVTAGGAAPETRFQVTGGTLRLHDGRYELRLEGWLLADGAPPVPATVASDGVVVYDVVTGAPMFHEREDWQNQEPRFRSRIRPDGGLELDWSRAPGAAVVPLVFAP